LPSRRILIANYEYPPLGGGGSTCSRYLARELVRNGHEVEVVTAAFKNLPRDVRKPNFRLRRLPALRRQTGQSNPIEMMSYVATAAPYLALRRGPKPDIVLSFHSIPSGLAAWPMSLIRGVPHIVLFRGGDVPGWLPGDLDLYHRLTLWLNRAIVYSSAAALANSDGLRDLAQKSFPKKKIGVLANGVDLKQFTPPVDGRKDRSGPIRLLSLGRITSQKGIDTLLEALGSDQLRDQNWHLDLGGIGPELSKYQDLARKLGLLQKISFLGWVDRKDIRLVYDAADILVFPSRFEGMPNVVLEGVASGLPIVGTRIAGTEEIVRDGENGFLIEVDDQQALIGRIDQLINDEQQRLEMGKKARALAEEQWSWKARAKELEAVMESVLVASG
jgi:glycogen synthase